MDNNKTNKLTGSELVIKVSKLVFDKTGKVRLPFNILRLMVQLAELRNVKELTLYPMNFDLWEIHFDDLIETAKCTEFKLEV